MSNPRINLIIGIISISIFPVLVKWAPVSGVTSAFYRMFLGLLLLLPYVLFRGKFTLPSAALWFPIVLCGIIFASDIAVWNLSIHYSNATQATLLTNLSPVWVGVGTFLFLPDKPAPRFWLGTLIALIGMVILIGVETFMTMKFDLGFALAMLSGVLYASYMLISKTVLNKIDIVSFMTVSMAVSSIYLFIICLIFDQPIWHFEPLIWGVFVVQGLVCQLIGWLTINAAMKQMDAKSVSLSLLSQAIVTGIFAWVFIGEKITPQMIGGGVIILIGIAITYTGRKKPAQGQAPTGK
ncbi:drug/metabolite transporter (DMT)-like permease [Dyadobacter sp. BE34]|uniref:Drug/metabolite transporter (DMT)-like permease n=1 Tax=Dyadobacter fermentans TaxID=94254 RepID=A0ABU1R1Q8_9BACT|nr:MULTISPECIES: DMT family transporter [Dyadobacter]MDR6807341.1 drug/metabolite transporter (DMT)-like permease [Dyadobacter fermentans]MDR7045082.1 drug/metabolite transporter (DMT)-like permease [Dyadobacter sp. BE242]MDR7199182.1 drug/metabolite transporter (DMT)-like permease [Dyadobacter sp. BE34]MDR7217142.1 drug/metabolite transporter (DMT)-like permease [Dyadobacter sp. BE31]MDR7265075.1 drug/metabolite transporter (DMT)-like permease [Dyadobacter sp. BE32]